MITFLYASLFKSWLRVADGKWDMEEYRNGAVGWCRYITGINEVDAAYESLLRV